MLVLLLQVHAADMTVLRNQNNMEMHIIDTGAIVQRLIVPDANGQLADIVAGFDDFELYDVRIVSMAWHCLQA